jgi:uncharacterized membrane protein YhfC
VEALFTAGLVLVTFVNMMVLRQMGLETLGLTGKMLEQAQAQVEAYWSMAWYLPLLGGLERVFAMAIQIALSLLVVRSLTRDNPAWLLAAVGVHALVDGVVVYLGGVGWSPLALEGVVLLFALAALALILVLRPRHDSQAVERAPDVSRENST